MRGHVGFVVLVAGIVGCSGEGSETVRPAPPEPEPEELAPGTGDFYAVPDPLPAGDHGDLLRYQALDDPPEGVSWYRVMALTETVAGDPTVVTGVVTVPDGAPPEADGWPVIAHAHGSTGLADVCSPSVSLGEGDGASAVEVLLFAGQAAAHGVVVASTDYEGLGGPGRHPFLVGESEGRGVLDIALAAHGLPGVEVSNRTAISGYSQGGHAALWAHQLAPDWAPRLEVVGTLAGAPATELAATLAGADPELRAQFEVSVVGGLAAAYPDADPNGILTGYGRDVLARLDEDCPPVGSVFPDAPLLVESPTTAEPWATLLAENTPGAVAAPDPVLIIHSQQDANVPIATSATLLERLCAGGQVTERRVLPEGDHVGAGITAYLQAFDWFDGLWAGDPPLNDCPSSTVGG